MLEIEEMVEFKTKEKLTESFLEEWNDQNPEHKLDPDLIKKLSSYLRYAYVAGWDDHRILVNGLVNGPGKSINKYFFRTMKWLNDLEKEL